MKLCMFHCIHKISFCIIVSSGGRFDFEPLFRGQTGIAKLQSACNLLIIDPRGL